MRVVLLVLSLATWAAAQTRPASLPTTAPTVIPLDEGRLRVTVAEGWRLRDRTADGRQANFVSDLPGLITVGVTTQEAALGANVKNQVARQIANALRQDVAKRGHKELLQPRIENDAAFYLRIYDRYEVEGRAVDRRHYYRVFGLSLVSVGVSAFTDDPELIKAVHAAGEWMALRALPGTAQRGKKTESGK